LLFGEGLVAEELLVGGRVKGVVVVAGDEELEGGVDAAEEVDGGFVLRELGVAGEVAAVDYYVDRLKGFGVWEVVHAMGVGDDEEPGADAGLV
jgi:hypothetical protein